MILTFLQNRGFFAWGLLQSELQRASIVFLDVSAEWIKAMWVPLLGPVVISVLFILSKPSQVCGHSSDICDWVGSGLHQGEPRGVKPLYLRCTQGHIKWHYPRGALRTLLRPPLSNFQGCIRVSANSTGARLYLEGERKLFPLFRPGDGKSAELHRCFTSRRGQVALYVEADPPTDLLRKDTIEFTYDLVAQEDLTDDMEECRPCNEEEILRSYCTSHFVVQGTVSSLSHNTTVERSEVTVLAAKVIKDTPPKSWNSTKYITLFRPLKCGTKVGRGEFLFMGRFRLDLPIIHCVPRLVQWKEIKRKALEQGTNLCQLD